MFFLFSCLVLFQSPATFQYHSYSQKIPSLFSYYEIVIIELKRREGFSSKPYLDNGVWAIGYGEHFESYKTLPSHPISEKKATLMLNLRLEKEYEHIDMLFPQLLPRQKWALVSLSYNVGMTNIRKNRRFWEGLMIGDEKILKKAWLTDFSKSINRHRSRELEWALFSNDMEKVHILHREALAIVKSRYARQLDFAKPKL